MKRALCLWRNLQKKKKKKGGGRNDKANCVQYFGVAEVIKSCISKNAVVKENIEHRSGRGVVNFVGCQKRNK